MTVLTLIEARDRHYRSSDMKGSPVKKRGQVVNLPTMALMRSVLPGPLEKKVHQLETNLPSKQTLRLVRLSFANRYLMKAMLAQATLVAVRLDMICIRPFLHFLLLVYLARRAFQGYGVSVQIRILQAFMNLFTEGFIKDYS